MMTPAFNHLLRFDLVCRAEKVSKLINHPVVCHFGTRVNGTRGKVVPFQIDPEGNHKSEAASPQEASPQSLGSELPMAWTKTSARDSQTRIRPYGES